MEIFEKEIAGKKIVFEIGKMALQANGALLARCGETALLATACAGEPVKLQSFFPLTVSYIEKFYAAGKFPGGFFKREGKPGEKETLTSRFIDRPLRPLFPESFFCSVQVITTVLSSDNKEHPGILALNAASMALCLSDIPFHGPVGAVRIGRINGEFVINASNEEMEKSDMDIIVAGTKNAIIMVEGSAEILPETDMINALKEAHTYIRELVVFQEEIAAIHGKKKMEFEPYIFPEDIGREIEEFVYPKMEEAVFLKTKMLRSKAKKDIYKELEEKYAERIEEDPDLKLGISFKTSEIEKKIIRKKIIEEEKRSDGRGLTDIRPISVEVGLFKPTHGSALFTRGETQSLGVVTLGTEMDMQLIDTIEGESKDRFVLHYNFPPFSVGETSMLRPPARREIGHGSLARRALTAVLPPLEEFPYAVRVVSEILACNGSSSMASVCSGSLSLMDAGVPVKAPVAGIAMGLIEEGDKYIVLSDILGEEDHCGDMDFKVAGTKEGVTAIQMDSKIEGIEFEILEKAFNQAKQGRMYILDEMGKVIDKSRDKLAASAPKIVNMKISKEKIGALIGPGGKVVRGIIEETGVKIDISDDGSVNIASNDDESIEAAIQLIKIAIKDIAVGEVYKGTVRGIEKYGAFVEILPKVEGLLHISEIADGYVKNVHDHLKLGQEVEVKVIKVDDNDKINLSRKALLREN